MAYIDGFEHDIFISYAHVDNLAATGKLPWIEEFHKRLDIALAQRIGRAGVRLIVPKKCGPSSKTTHRNQIPTMSHPSPAYTKYNA